MKEYKANRRNFVKTSVAGAAIRTLGVSSGRVELAAEAVKLQIKIAGYDYDRVRAIMDGQVGIEGAEVNFDASDIYAMNKSAFGPERWTPAICDFPTSPKWPPEDGTGSYP